MAGAGLGLLATLPASACGAGRMPATAEAPKKASAPVGSSATPAPTASSARPIDEPTMAAVRACATYRVRESFPPDPRAAECHGVAGALGLVTRHVDALCDKGDADGCWTAALLRDRVVVVLSLHFADPSCPPGKRCLQTFSSVVGDAIAGASASPEQAQSLYDKACSLGRIDACNRLAVFSASAARPYLAKLHAACKDDASSCAAALRVVLDGGLVDAPLFEVAASVFSTGCAASSATACANLGFLRATGRGTKKDVRGAAEALDRACGLDLDVACRTLVKLRAADGQAAGAKADWARAAKTLTARCDAGGSEDCGALAVAYRRGIGVKASGKKADELEKRAK